jgi:hypothetical protein
MTDDPVQAQQGQATDPAQLDDARDAMEHLRQLFATLVPPDTLELQDALGNTYTARAALPARAQIKVMQQLQALSDREVSMPTAGTDAAGMIGMLVQLAADPVVLDGVADAFAAAHPAVLVQARDAAKAQGLDYTHPADLFPVEDLVAGLVPFFVRFARRAADLMGQVTGPTE